MSDVETPENAVLFYASIFDWITFDIFPTDYIYGLLLEFTGDTPYNDKVDTAGYGSRFLITNSGSLSIFIVSFLII